MHIDKWPETSADHNNVLFIQSFGRLLVLTIRTKYRRVRKTIFYQVQTHQPIIHFSKVGPFKTDHVYLYTVFRQAVHQRKQKYIGDFVIIKTGIDEIYTQYAYSLLL